MKILKPLFLFSYLFIQVNLCAQNIDSVLSAVSLIKKSTARLDTLSSIVSNVKSTTPQFALDLAPTALSYAEKLNNKEVAGQIYYDMSSAYYYQYKIDSMLLYAELALQIGDEVSKRKLSYSAHNLLGIGYMSQQKYGTALEHFNSSIQEAEANQDTVTAGPALVNLAQIYNFMGDSIETIRSYHRAIGIFERYNDSLNLAVTHQNLGILITDLDSSITILSAGLELFEGLGHTIGQGYTLNSIASRMIEKGDYLDGIRYLNRARALMEEIEFVELLPSIYLNIANASAKKGLFTKAEEYWAKAATLATENEDLLFLRDFYESKSKEQEDMGLFEASLISFQQYDAIKDSMDRIERQEELEGLKAKYENDKRRAEIKLLNKDVQIRDITIRRTTIIASILGVGALILLGLAGLAYRYYRRARQAQQRSDELLLNILPAEVAEELKVHGKTAAKSYDSIAVLFTDFEDFSSIAHELSPNEVVQAVDFYFKEFDIIMERHGIEKIKTIGDAYFAVSGLNNLPSYVDNIIEAAIEMQEFVQKTKTNKCQNIIARSFDMRIGIHVGPVVAGVVGIKKFQYDIWGDTVNVASRMESNCNPGRITISDATYKSIDNITQFAYEDRGAIEIKNLGLQNCYFVNRS